MTPALFSADMKPLRLSSRVGKGGEGEVYALEGVNDQVVKFYTVTDTRSREAKIKKMIADDLSKVTPLIAFPISVIRNKGGAFAGFTMMKVSGHQPLHELYAPGVRKAAFPRADYRFLVRTAANIARAVGSAHNTNCIIGDINHSGFLISEQAKVALIDADSFQVMDGATRYACKVGTPEYTPPELQGQNLDGVLRTQNHDAFGLAVVIFQLLWMGRHPFSGKYSAGEMPMEKAISELRFAYSSRAVGMQPPPATPKLKDFPRAMGAAFEQAFGPQGRIERPSAKQWITLLKELEDSLVKCPNNSLHHYPPDGSECPWCRMERMFGVPLFVAALPEFAHSAAFVPMSGDIAAIWRAIEAVVPPANANPVPKLNISSSLPSSDASAAASSRFQQQALGAALVSVAAVALFAAPEYWILALIIGGFGLNRLFVKPQASRDFAQRYREIEIRWLQAEQSWKVRAGAKEFDILRSRLAGLKTEYEGLAVEEKRRIQEHTANRRSEQLRVYLEGFQIRRIRIAHVGPAKLAMLTSYGIETAADVSSVAVQNVPGFGPVNSVPLVEWRSNLERRFVYNANPTQADTTAVNRIRADIANRAVQIKAELGTGPERLRKMAQAIWQVRESVDATLQQLSDQRAQALADLRCVGISPPTVTLTAAPASSPSAQPRTATASSQGQRCPRCGSPMISRMARRGLNAGGRFLGCTRYPQCKGTRSTP
jgi:DNA-binding helix-hairpin-helix protein with protein kinase domain